MTRISGVYTLIQIALKLFTIIAAYLLFIQLFSIATPSFAQIDQACPDWTDSSLTLPGCPCNPLPRPKTGACPDGYVCAQPWSKYLTSPDWRINLSSGDSPSSSSPSIKKEAPIEGAFCQPCTYGQFCPPGTVLPSPTETPDIQMALSTLDCPTGKHCPTPSTMKSCPAGSFCSAGTVQPVSCDLNELIEDYPSILIPARPYTVFQRVYALGTPTGGNYCSVNASTPVTQCKAGSYCPSPGVIRKCPADHYCKPGSIQPTVCPPLTSCPTGSEKASLSWTGFLLLAAILAGMLLVYVSLTASICINQKKLLRTHEARERLWKLLNPLFAPRGSNAFCSQGFRAFKTIRPKITIEFDSLGLTLHDGTPILKNVSGKFPHSRVTAIMGPSGAGKSSLLNVLMGQATKIGRTTGRVIVNGREMKMSKLQSITGVVPQEDIVHEDLTVRENLVFSARLRLSATKPLKEQMAVVDDVIDILQLRHVQHSVVGSVERRGISGGQRKRVNVGWELASKPSILLLDEPTSGLDSSSSADIIYALKQIAGIGLNVVTVIHQPRYSIFCMFDDVLLLGKGGRLVYLGPSRLALLYFSSLSFSLPPNENPADFAMDLLSGGVARNDGIMPQPEELFNIWGSYGSHWVKSQAPTFEDGGGLSTNALSVQDMQPRIDPEQLRLLDQAFDSVDADEDGSINKAELQSLLVGLGVEPTQQDVEMIMAELADPRLGIIQRDELLTYVRYGGRPPAVEPVKQDSRHAHKYSMYRVYSIEANVLSNELSKLAAEYGGTGTGTGTDLSLSSSPSSPPSTEMHHHPTGPVHRRTSSRAVPRQVSFALDIGASSSSSSSPSLITPPSTTTTPINLSDSTLMSSNTHSICRKLTQQHRITEEDEDEQQRTTNNSSAVFWRENVIAIDNDDDDDDDKLERRRASEVESPPVTIYIPPRAVATPFQEGSRPKYKGSMDEEEGEPPKSIATTYHSRWETSSVNTVGIVNTQDSSKKDIAATTDTSLPVSSSTTGSLPVDVTIEGTQKVGGGKKRRGRVTDSSSSSSGGGGGILACLALHYSTSSSSSKLRTTPGNFAQMGILTVRTAIKWARGWNTKLMDLILLILAGLVCGAVHGTGGEIIDVQGQTALIMLGLGLISVATSLGVFGRDRVVYWRERASGIKLIPYFMSKTLLNLVDVALQPLVFLSIYTSLTLPILSFAQYYLVGVLVVWYCSSIGCLVSILVPPNNALVSAVALIIILGGFFNGVTPKYSDLSSGMQALTILSYNRWATEALVVDTFAAVPQHQHPLAKLVIVQAGYCGLESAPLPGDGNSSSATNSTKSTYSVINSSEDKFATVLDPAVYCSGYAERDLMILLLEGTVLRLMGMVALWLCPKGFTIDPLIMSVNEMVGVVVKKMKKEGGGRRRRKRREEEGMGAEAVMMGKQNIV